MIVCINCRKAAALALYAKGGYADGPKAACRACYDMDKYLQNRFTAKAISWTKRPGFLLAWTTPREWFHQQP